MKNLQLLLVRSHSAKLLAIRNITQRNEGRTTAGVDGKVYLTAEARMRLCRENFELNGYRPEPVRRVHVPKVSGGRRPLGVPTVRDRVMQAIVRMALEPEWEAWFEPNSYGFRPGRSCHDAIEQVWKVLVNYGRRGKEAWILEADITACFDNIAHAPLLARVPVFRGVIRRWLKVGAIELGHYREVEAGTPQGGVISPLLANIALDGLERTLARVPNVHLVRYADDFVVVTPARGIIELLVKPKIEQFLKGMGLTLNAAKTHVTRVEQGFHFLGFMIRRFSRGRQSRLVIKPEKGKVSRFLKRVGEILGRNKQAMVRKILVLLNPVLRGWALYYRYCNAKATFSRVDYHVFQKIRRWCKRRHPNRGESWVKRRYFERVGSRDWQFGEKAGIKLHELSTMPLLYYRKVFHPNSPYDPRLRGYWKERVRYVVANA